MRARTILALAALVVLSLVVKQVRSISAVDVWSYDYAVVWVDGAPRTITVGLPTALLSHVSSVSLVVDAPAGHDVTSGDVTGPFTTIVTVSGDAGGQPSDDPALRVMATVSADTPVQAQLAVDDGSGRQRMEHGTGMGTLRVAAAIRN